MKTYLLILLPALLLLSCNPEPQPIEYGSDMCDFCKMSIVDQQHAAEAVTTKVKVFKFDAIECLLHFKKEHQPDLAFQLVNVYHIPRELFPAESSFFLISKNLPSPMGANLTAFENEVTAQEMQRAKGGKIFTWQELESQFFEKGFAQTIPQ